MVNRGIYNVEYLGKMRSFIYDCTQEGYKHIKDIPLYSSFPEGYTLSKQTLEKLLVEQNTSKLKLVVVYSKINGKVKFKSLLK